MLKALQHGEMTYYESSVKEFKAYIELDSHGNFLKRFNEPRLLKLNEDCLKLADKVVLGYGDKVLREELERSLEEYIVKLKAVQEGRY